MIGCLWTRVHKQPIIALYFEFEIVHKLYILEARRTKRQDKDIDRRIYVWIQKKTDQQTEHAHKVFETIPQVPYSRVYTVTFELRHGITNNVVF